MRDEYISDSRYPLSGVWDQRGGPTGGTRGDRLAVECAPRSQGSEEFEMPSMSVVGCLVENLLDLGAHGAEPGLTSRSTAGQLGAFRSARFQHAGITFGTAFDFARLATAGAVADAVAGDGGQDAVGHFRQFGVGRVQQRRPKLVERLQGTREAELARRELVFRGRLSHHFANQVVGQQVGPDFFTDHLGGLAAQDVHLHLRLDRTQIDLGVPTGDRDRAGVAGVGTPTPIGIKLRMLIFEKNGSPSIITG
jgi:hypothetical protein